MQTKQQQKTWMFVAAIGAVANPAMMSGERRKEETPLVTDMNQLHEGQWYWVRAFQSSFPKDQAVWALGEYKGVAPKYGEGIDDVEIRLAFKIKLVHREAGSNWLGKTISTPVRQISTKGIRQVVMQ